MAAQKLQVQKFQARNATQSIFFTISNITRHTSNVSLAQRYITQPLMFPAKFVSKLLSLNASKQSVCHI